jgi:hypothetical protein
MLAAVNLTHKPIVLYHASIERIVGARRLLEAPAPDYVMAMYQGGLAIECLLQAFALRHGEPHDARHNLVTWLGKCPAALQDAVKTKAPDQWNHLIVVWDNGLRYLSSAGLLGYLRKKGRTYGVSGGPEAIIRMNAKALVLAAAAVHHAGVTVWLSYTEK